MGEDTPAALGALRVDEGKLRGHVDEVVRSSVEETLNGLLDEEAEQICRPAHGNRVAPLAISHIGQVRYGLLPRFISGNAVTCAYPNNWPLVAERDARKHHLGI